MSDDNDDQVIDAYRGPLPDREDVHPSVFEVEVSLLAILRDDDDSVPR
jgi:hypothetical protein